MRHVALGLVLLAGGLALSNAALAQIVLKPAGGESAPLRPKSLDLDVTIRRAVAESKFDYVFANEGQWRGEADFLIAIPENGVVTGFAYWYEGEKVVARVTEKERARDIYRAITTRQRDPALIEMVGKRTFRVKVFPVEANADLRVELKMVQALPSTANGSQLVVPLKRLGKLERIDVDVRGEGSFASNLVPRPVPNLQYRAANATTPDLRITAIRPKRPYVADLRAARSGGAGGFFALTLTAARGVSRPRLSFSGVTVKDVLGVPTRMAPGKAYTVVGRYENVRPGARVYLAGTGGARFSEALDFAATPEPNGPAAKLWAWAKLGRSTDRKEIVALSVRHTVPSKYTSWIAIPKAERERFDQEIRQGDLRRFGRALERTIKRYGIRSPQAKRGIVAYRAKAQALNVDLRNVQLDLWDPAAKTTARWQAAVKRSGENSPAATRLRADLEAFATLGINNSEVTNYYYSRATDLAERVYEDRYAGRTDAAARARRTSFERSARLSGQSDGGREMLENYGTSRARELTDEIVALERAGQPVPAEKARDLQRRERASGLKPDTYLNRRRTDAAYSAVQDRTMEMQTELASSEPNLERLRALQKEREKDLPRLRKTDWRLPSALEGARTNLSLFLDEVAEGKRSVTEVAARKVQLAEFADAIGEPIDSLYESAVGDKVQEVRLARDYQEKMARRDRKGLAEAQRKLDNLAPLGNGKPRWTYTADRGEPDQEARDAYVRARHEGEPAEKELERLRAGDGWRGTEYPKTRAELLQTLTELDAMDARPLSSEEERTKAELERKATELHARIGDPIVTFEAPEDAIGLHAVLPDGTRLPMVWVLRHRRWEARFDIPAGTPDGPFAVRIDGAYADGRPISSRAEFRVDTHAPSVQVERDGTILVVKTDEDVVRAVAIGADGTRREMVRHAPGRFALRDAPAGEVRVVATDRAHNRSDMASTVALPMSEPIDPAMNVQALARFGDRLWISTLDAGGRFEGGETVPEVGPWPRQAASFGGALAVRSANGEVNLFDGRKWSMVERDATTLAAEGERLLVGLVGGWIERSGAVRKVVRPADLMGRVVTCLLPDGDRLWIGTQGRGLYEYDRTTGTGRWHDERDGLTDDWITALGRDASGRVVVGTFVGGALTCDEGTWRVLEGTEGTCVTAVLEGAIATRRGIYREGRWVADGEAQALAGAGSSLVLGWRGRIDSFSAAK